MKRDSISHIQVLLKENIRDVAAERIREDAQKYLNINTGNVKSGKIFSLFYQLGSEQIDEFANKSISDPILHDVFINKLFQDESYQSYILVSKLPGVTDDEGVSAQKALCDLFNIPFDYSKQLIFTRDIYYLENKINEKQLHLIAEELLGNPLINHFDYGRFNGKISYMPTVDIKSEKSGQTVDIFMDDRALLKLSKDLLLALDLEEMKAIQKYYADEHVKALRLKNGLPELPTETEIEVLAQTWSEHCKHKEFNAIIEYHDLETGQKKTIDSLFKTYIRRSTEIIRERFEKTGQNWLIKIFTDNAGVVRIDNDRVFIWKVETHNSPSALDPYGGALTGIVGVNRDPLGTGVGGGKLLFNTNILCFGSPYYEGKLLPGQLHPRRIISGVVKGIEDGGNKSGIPTVNGSIIFDDRFRGKPLVYCGTGAVMPARYQGKNSWDKRIDPGDKIIMAGGRVGKDGIHGATFSSLEIDEHSPRSAVQIGSPITQKNMSDFMEQAVQKGWIKASTDNGAGGLSSSIGELATITNGAIVHLEKVPVKYTGLKPWEIFVSESQERMSFVVEKKHLNELFGMAADFEVELSDIGCFTDEGFLDIRFGNEKIAYLDLHFLHDGVPRKFMTAEWKKPKVQEPALPQDIDHNTLLLKLLNSLNICSREYVIRRYDHEVKGKTIVKPLMGKKGVAPQDAAVMRLGFDSYAGIAVSNGILPRYGDIDAYQMSAGSFDEALRGIIAVGGRLPDPENREEIFWTVNDNFCVPDSLYHPVNNPDGKYKLAQLVKMNEALFDMATFFNIPMTSGKDSMKNDFIKEGIKISVPPTILYSMVSKIPDIRKAITSEFKMPGDRIYLIGITYDELGGSEFYRLFNELGANVPEIRKEEAKRVYLSMMKSHKTGILQSAHDISDGGLVVALAECVFGSDTGALIRIENSDLNKNAILYAETHSRFIVSVKREDAVRFEKICSTDAVCIGEVTDSRNLVIEINKEKVLELSAEKMLQAWSGGLKF